MTANETPRPGSAPRKPIPPAVRLLAVVGLLFGLYQGATFLVRVYVDGRIAAPVGSEVVDFELQDTTGKTWRAADLRGRHVVLNFFRSQCVSCRLEKDAVKQLAARVEPERALVLGVFLDRVQGYDPEMSARTLEWFGYEHPVLWADAAFVDAFHGSGWSNVTPVTYVLDPSGRIESSARGHQDLEQLLAMLPENARGS